jgi:hypothetical protein
MFRALVNLITGRQPSAAPVWTPADERALSEARAHHERRSTLLQRKQDAVHGALAQRVWGSTATGWRGPR